MIIGHQLRCHKRTGAYHDSILGHTLIHIDNTAIRLREIVHKAWTCFRCVDRQHQTIRFHRINLQISCRTLMHCNQIFQAFFHSFSITGLSIGKAHSIFQCNLPGKIIYQLISFCDPWLQLHGVIDLHQSFSNAITYTCPSAVCAVRINVGFLIFCIEGGISKDKCFLTSCICTGCCLCLCTTCTVSLF